MCFIFCSAIKYLESAIYWSYIKSIPIEWDEGKNEANFAKHGLRFESFEGFDTEPVVLVDDRRDYGEERFRAFGRIDGEPHSIAYTTRGDDLRLISFRPAHEKEIARYE